MRHILIVLLLSITTFGSIEWNSIGKTSDNKIITEIKQTLDDGWYTYWKNPGDSGGRAKISFKNSTTKHSGLKFPKPTVLTYDPLVTYGYKNSVTYQLIIESQLKDIEATFSWLECNDVCIPKETTITLKKENNKLPIIPTPINQQIKTNITKIGKKLVFNFSEPVQSAIFFPYENGFINPIKQSVKKNKLTIKITGPLPEKITGELFINSSSESIQIDTAPIQQSSPIKEFIIIILGALIGGALLNIMPCVLPIIGIKALQLNKQSSESRKKDALLYQLGVTTSILSLFLGLYILQFFGKSVGWGFQLQSPIMIQFLIMLFIIFLLSSLDTIVIQAPKRIQNTSIANHFGSGMITTIVATPCTAPFLGSALTYALFQPFIFGLVIFLALSIGLGAPITLLMLNPRIKPFIPKSGNWNQSIKYGLGFGFVATIIWLTWILSNQVSTQYLITFYLVISLVIYTLIRKSALPFKRSNLIQIIITIIGIIVVVSIKPTSQNWQQYSFEKVSILEDANMPYFIDVTAKWCITCQTNKLTVLNRQIIKTAFKEKNLTLIQADWTNYDDSITELLKKHNQVSIPTYIYYNGSEYNVINDIITVKDIKRMIEK